MSSVSVQVMGPSSGAAPERCTALFGAGVIGMDSFAQQQVAAGSDRSGRKGRIHMSGFRKFLMRGNLIDLAVAVVIGVAFNAVVQALVADVITPLIAAIGGKHNFGALTFTIHHSTFFYGRFINALLSFLTIAAVVY